MKIYADGKRKTVIEFSREELEGCLLTYENISRNEIRSKTAIHTIIAEAAKLSGNGKIIDENTAIDILPDGDGGCVIILNNVPAQRAETGCAVLFSENADCFFDLARATAGNETVFSSLYKTLSGYALYLEGRTAFLQRCNEFCDVFFCGKIYRERLDEYAEPLIKGNALEILSGTVSEK